MEDSSSPPPDNAFSSSSSSRGGAGGTDDASTTATLQHQQYQQTEAQLQTIAETTKATQPLTHLLEVDDDRLLFGDTAPSRQVATNVTTAIGSAAFSGGGSKSNRKESLSKDPWSSLPDWKVIRNATVEIPLTVNLDESNDIGRFHPGPQTRLSTSTTVPISSSMPQLSARLAATAVTHRNVGHITHDVALQYRHFNGASKTPTTPVVLTTTAGLTTVRNRRRPYVQLQAQFRSQSSPKELKSSNPPTMVMARYTHPSLANPAVKSSPNDVPLMLCVRRPMTMLGGGTLAVQCQPMSLWNISSSSASLMSLGWEAATIHPWRVQLGLRWRRRDEMGEPSVAYNTPLTTTWHWSTTPRLSSRHTLRLTVHSSSDVITSTPRNVGWWPSLSISAHWVQRLRNNLSLGLGLTLPSTTSNNTLSKAQWLVVWQHGDFVLRVPILFDTTGGNAAWWTSVIWASVTPLIHAAVKALWEMTSGRKEPDDATDLVASQQRQRQEYFTVARTRAQQQQALMQRQADVRRRDSGLVIQAATYYLPQSSDPLDKWDVTTAIQFWVTTNGNLELPGGSSKGSLLGFVDLASLSNYNHRSRLSSSPQTNVVDPLFSWSWWTAFGRPRPVLTIETSQPSSPPRLRIVYEYLGQRHEVDIDDTERLVLPGS
jgi:hypothetical protein